MIVEEDALNGGECLLKECIQGLLLQVGWCEIKKHIASNLLEFSKKTTGNDVFDLLGVEIKNQLLLESLGPEMRELWGTEIEIEYKPELLREPYLPINKKTELVTLVQNLYMNYVKELCRNAKMDESSALKSSLDLFFIETKIHFQGLLRHKKRTMEDSSFQEDIGKALMTTIMNQDIYLKLLATPFTPYSTITSKSNKKEDELSTFSYGKKYGVTSYEDINTKEVDDILTRYDPKAVSNLCSDLKGVILSESLRTELWSYRFMTREDKEAPSSRSLHVANEVTEKAIAKGLEITTEGLKKSPMGTLFATSTAIGVRNALSVTSFSSSENDGELNKLSKRVELLLHAVYILNEDFSNRILNICILLLWAFPNEQPTSEKILRMYQRIILECMPSEQIHKDYSLASVAHKSWALLLDRDRELLHFLQNYRISNDAIEFAKPGADDIIQVQNEIQTAASAMEVPRSMTILRGWLEDGFMGWVSEYTSLFLWDQLVLLGANPNTFRQILPTLCCILLQCLRSKILATPPGCDIIQSIKTYGKNLKTKLFIEAFRRETSIM